MKNLFIVPLKQSTIIDNVDITTILKPSSKYLKQLHPAYTISEVYPEDAITFAEGEDEEDEDQITDIDENRLLGYNLSYPYKVKEEKLYCLVADMEDYLFPIAYSPYKAPLETYRLNLDWDSISCRISLMANSKKHIGNKYTSVKELTSNYLVDIDASILDKELIRLYNIDMRYVDTCNEVEEGDDDE